FEDIILGMSKVS
ncbi:hypothetical protein XELAEV_180295234mg, partial [Xenopus laevis]